MTGGRDSSVTETAAMFAEGVELEVSGMMEVTVKSGSGVAALRQQRNWDAS